MADINRYVFTGRLARDPLTKTNGDMKISRFTVACEERKTRSASNPHVNWINCVAFRNTAEFIEKYITKGMAVTVGGMVHTDSYDRNGQKVYTTDVYVQEIKPVFTQQAQTNQQPQQRNQQSYSNTANTSYQNTSDDTFEITADDLPF